MPEPVDLIAALLASVEEARARNNEPCPRCGGDRLQPNFREDATTCHTPRKANS